MQDSGFIGKMVRQHRPKDKNGKCRDTAKCTVVINGEKKVYNLGRWNTPQANAEYKRIARLYYIGELQHEKMDVAIC